MNSSVDMECVTQVREGTFHVQGTIAIRYVSFDFACVFIYI